MRCPGACQMSGIENNWLSADEIAAHLGISKDTVYAWIAIRGLPAHRVGRLWKFQRFEVDGWVRSGKAADDEYSNEKN
jgi:excisionase family DNA binding protein